MRRTMPMLTAFPEAMHRDGACIRQNEPPPFALRPHLAQPSPSARLQDSAWPMSRRAAVPPAPTVQCSVRRSQRPRIEQTRLRWLRPQEQPIHGGVCHAPATAGTSDLAGSSISGTTTETLASRPSITAGLRSNERKSSGSASSPGVGRQLRQLDATLRG